MTRLTLALISVAAFAAGCTPAYTVHINTFSQPKEPLSPATPIYVSVDPNARNPILAQRIAAKIRTLLQERGYTAAEKVETARYVLTFRAGMDYARYLGYAPIYQPYGAFYGFGGFHPGFGFGYTTYVPYIETIYAHWIDVRLYPQGEAARDRTPPLWIGEAVVGMDQPELREAVDYLLVGLMPYFGQDTRRWVDVRLKANDPRILALAETP